MGKQVKNGINLEDHNPPGSTQNYINRDAVAQNLPTTPIVPSPNKPSYTGDGRNSNATIADLWNAALAAGEEQALAPSIPLSSFPDSSRFSEGARPGDDWEEVYAQNQGVGSKMVNGVAKGLSLAGTTFLQTTAGTVNGLIQMYNDKRWASFYDNEFNKTLDEWNAGLEDSLPNFYTHAEKDARWYSPTKLFTANFFWDGIVKNLGFAAGAAGSGYVFSAALKAIPLASRLSSMGKAAETLTATEQGLAAGTAELGAIKAVNDAYLASSNAYNSLNKAQRVLVAALSTTGEAGFEAYHNLNDFRKNAIEEYKKANNGRAPEGADLEAINEAADKIGNSSAILNMMLLSATNYIQFPKILGSSYKAEKGVANSVTKKINDVVVDETGQFVESSIIKNKALRAINSVRPYLFSASEAFEEGAQYAISKGTEDYFNKRLNGETNSIFDSMIQGIAHTLGTDEGMENVLLGGLSGSLMMGLGRYRENRELSDNTRAALSSSKWSDPGLNSAKLSDFQKATFDAVSRGVQLQKEREEFIEDGDILNSKDIEADYIINYLTPRIKYNRYDLVKSDIEEARKVASSPQGWADLVSEGKVVEGDTQQAYLERLANFERTAENVKTFYQTTNLRFKGLLDEKGERVYSDAVIDKMVYALSKIADYDTRIPDVKGHIISSGISNIDEIINDTIASQNNNTDNSLLESAVAAINSREDITDTEKEENIERLYDVVNMSIRRNNFIKNYNQIKNSPNNFKAEEEMAPVENAGETVKLNTKVGEKEFTIGEEYYLGNVIKYTDTGKEVYRFPKLTILGENEDGTIKIRDKNGERDITKDKFEEYGLMSVKEMREDPDASFYVDNANQVIIWNKGLKKGGEVAGRLRYDPSKKELYFVYKSGKKLKEKLISAASFEPAEGFSRGVFYKSGRVLTAADQSNINKVKTSGKAEATIQKSRSKRLEILTELYLEISDNHERRQRTIEQHKAELARMKKQLAEYTETISTKAERDKRATKTIKFKKSTVELIKSANNLTKAIEKLQNEITILEEEGENVNDTLAYIDDLANNLDRLSDDYKEFLSDLRLDKAILVEAAQNNVRQMGAIKSLIKSTERAIQTAIAVATDLITRFEAKYPNVPRIMGQPWVDFIQANPNFTKLQPNYKEDLLSINEQIAFVEEQEIVPSEAKLEKLNEHLELMQEDLMDIDRKISAMQPVLDKFQNIYDEYRKTKKEEAIFVRNSSLIQKIVGTHTVDPETSEPKKEYEPFAKKIINKVISSTLISSAWKKPHHLRADRFAFRFKKQAPEDIKGILITKNTEDAILPGFTDHLKNNADIPMDPASVIALIFVKTNPDGSYTMVNEFLEPLTEDEKRDALNHAVYQVFPTEALKAQYGGKWETMFRSKETEADKTAATAQYTAWRKKILSQTEIGSPLEVEPSFGTLQRVKKTITDEKGITKEVDDYDARVSVVESQLIPKESLNLKPVLKVATPVAPDTSITVNGVTYENASGKVFLTPDDGLVPVNNRKLNKGEATVIFKVLKQLSTNLIKDENLSQDSMVLIDWLKTIVYWGIPKNQAGHNSLWFQQTTSLDGAKSYKLFMSGKGEFTTFSPSALEANKEEIISVLQSFYHHVSATDINAKKYDNDYLQITDIDSSGKPIVKSWNNYQTYLLSPEGRSIDNVPLTTNVAPIKDENDFNRKGIYFSIVDNLNMFERPAPVSKEVKNPPAKPVAAVIAPTNIPNRPPMPPIHLVAEDTAPTGNSLLDSFVEPENLYGNSTLETFLETSEEFVRDGKTTNVWNWIPPGGNQSTGYITFLANEEGVIPNSINLVGRDLIAQMEMSYKDRATINEKLAKYLTKKINEAPVTTPAAAPTNPVVPTPPVRETPPTPDVAREAYDNHVPTNPNLNDNFKLVVEEEVSTFDSIDWAETEAWFKKVLPNIPFYRVKNLIKATKNRMAYGMFHQGAVYISNMADQGTVFHEVFEAVWNTFATPEEQAAIIKEFRSKKGEFVDRFSPFKRRIKFSEATASEIKEELAEQFAEYKLTGKIPARTGSIFGNLIKDLMNWIRNMVLGENAVNNVNELFKRIDKGYYASSNPYNAQLAFANAGFIDIEDASGDLSSQFKLIPAKELHDIMQHMTFLTIKKVISKNDLFNPTAINSADLYGELYGELLNLLAWKKEVIKQLKAEALDKKDKQIISIAQYNTRIQDLNRQDNEGARIFNSFIDQWPEIVKEHKNMLKSYSIDFDENDELQLTDENNSGKADYQDARKIDHFRKTSAAVRLLLATLPEREVAADGSLQPKLSSIGGLTMMDVHAVYSNLMESLHTSVNLEDMIERLRKLAAADPNYNLLYKRLFNVDHSTEPNWRNLNETNVKLIASFWKAFKKQSPDVATVFILSNGEIIVSDTSLTTAAKTVKRSMTYDMIDYLKNNSPYIAYNPQELTYSSTTDINKVNLDPNNLDGYIAFLNNIGITQFTKENTKKFGKTEKDIFIEAVTRIKTSLAGIQDVKSFTAKTINAEGRLFELGLLLSKLEKVSYESTYFNVNGERTQTHIGTNLMSTLYDTISQISNLSELRNTPFSYLLTDKFSEGSVVLDYMFDKTTGNKKTGRGEILKPTIMDGTVDESKGKKSESSRLSYRNRIIQEINNNINGIFSNLIPGDASIEWGIRLFANKESELVSMKSFVANKHIEIFKNYLASEIELARDTTRLDVVSGNKTHLRFFKGILSEATHTKIISDTETDINDLIEANKTAIEKEIREFIKQDAIDTIDLLAQYNIILGAPEGYVATELDIFDNPVTKEDLQRKFEQLNVNYMIANIELHKLLYSDPYQYSDELKRIKSFTSPRQMLMHGSENISESMDVVYNKDYKKGDIGWTDTFKQTFNAVTLGDIWSHNEELPGYEDPYEETDGAGIVTLKGKRLMDILSGEWDDYKELQYRYDIAYEKYHKGIPLSSYEKSIFNPDKNGTDNPGIQSLYTNLKPIVTGSKESNRGYNDVVLDKFALVTYSYRILHQLNPNSNALRLYEKMQKENVEYAVFKSGRKTGAEVVAKVYNKDGSFNKQPFSTQAQNNNPALPQTILKIPYSIIGIQTEVPTKSGDSVTQGSQITKLATMDFLEAGVPIDFPFEGKFEDKFAAWIALSEEEKRNISPLYKEIKNNQELLEESIKTGIDTLMKKLGLSKVDNGYKIVDKTKLTETLKSEILKREVNKNIIQALDGFAEGAVVLEATPAYKQIRNILFSIANKTVIKPKRTGGMRVQIASSLLEENRVVSKTFTRKDGSSFEAYVSKTLKFYKNEDGKRVCEIMIGRWFDSNMTDDELLVYLNNTKEGQKILSGIGFRIPTQKQNSIDAFKVAKFLPKEFKDSVVIPSALVRKTGSDFDIDKLSIYLKNVFKDALGNLKEVPFLGYGQQAKDKFEEMFYELLDVKLSQAREKLSKVEYRQAIWSKVSLGLADAKTREKWIPIFNDMFADLTTEDGLSAYEVEEVFIQQLESLNLKIDDLKNFEKQNQLLDIFIEKKYKESLENAYLDSLFNLTTHELNFDRLIVPNSADEAKNLARIIREKRGLPKLDYSTPSNMLKRNLMSKLRHYFVSGKQAIGIAAVGQTNNAQNQRALITIDNDALETKNIPLTERFWLGDGKIKFSKMNTFDGKPTLSFPKNADNKYISDVIGQVIDGYVDITKDPWIMELGITPNIAGTWLFLLKVGIPFETVAYFMNQPIIIDYLSNIENSGYKWIFIDQMYSDMLEKYSPTNPVSIDVVPNNIGDIVGKPFNKLNNTDKNVQQFVLKEFLKYAMMSNHLLVVTQGSNFDTANFNDPFLVLKKIIQLDKARNTIISSVDSLIDNSFLKTLFNGIKDIRDSFSEILISDKKESTRPILEAVLTPYTNLNDRDFVTIAQKAVENLFDYAVQTNTGLNMRLKELLLSDDKKNVARRILNLKKIAAVDKAHPLHNNKILESIQIYPGQNKNRVNNIYLKAKDNTRFNQDFIINSFKELKDYLYSVDKEVYTNLVHLAVVQSGLTASPISFTHLIPYEDFKEVYNDILSKLDSVQNLSNFVELNVFERVNAMNADIIPQIPNVWRTSKRNPDKKYNFNESFLNDNLKEAVKKGQIPKLINVGALTYNGQFDIVSYQWDSFPGVPARDIKKVKAEMIKKGDYSFVKKGLFKKVYYINAVGERVPLTQSEDPNENGDIFEHYIYKAINTWGDSYRAQEYYDEIRQSQLDTQYIKVDEVEDSVIEQIFEGVKAPVKPDVFPFQWENISKVHSGEKTTTVRTVNYESGVYIVDGRNFEITNRGLLTVEEAGGKESLLRTEAFGPKGPLFTSTNQFLEGKRKLYVYDIKPTTKGLAKKAEPKVTAPRNSNNTMSLKDGKTYKFSEINGSLLISLGYTPDKIGEILKIICK